MKLGAAIKKALLRLFGLSKAPENPAVPEVPDSPEVPDAPETPTAPAPALTWCYGGFNGGKAIEDPATQIADLKATPSGLSYKWKRGSLGAWGLAKTDPGAIACAFYWDGKNWRGGKFDWISTSRTTRDFKNILAGYQGWSAAAFFGARRIAFCIASADGRLRTNLIETTWKTR